MGSEVTWLPLLMLLLRLLSFNRAVEGTLPMLLLRRLFLCSKAVYLLDLTRESFNTSRLRQLFVLLSRSLLLLAFSFKDKNDGIRYYQASFFEIYKLSLK